MLKNMDNIFEIKKEAELTNYLEHFVAEYNNIDKIQSNYKLALPSNAKTIYEYQVKKGDTLGAISRKFGVDIADIIKANSKTNMKLAIGENLVIPH